MSPGKLRYLVAVQKPSGSRDAVGERTTVFTTMADVYASIEPVSTEERSAAAQARMEVTHRVTIRGGHDALTGLNGSWRILFGERPLVIVGIRNLEERDIWIELTCSEGMKEE